MSGEHDRLRYDFEVSPGSTYERAARLIASARLPGLVIDLGAGVGALAAAVAEYGFDTVGFDADAENIATMTARGRRAEPLDLVDAHAVEHIIEAVGEQPGPIAAVVMLDVIEHLPDPERSVALLAAVVDRFGTAGSDPLLVLSVPNVAHADLAAKLLLGRWDITDVGLLDSTHITLFTEQRLDELLVAHGFREVARNDVHLRESEQFAVGLPVVGSTTLADHLRAVRARADENGEIYQFVRSYERARAAAATPEQVPAGDRPFCSAIVRTQGRRTSLVDTLVSLAAQEDPDLEVLVMVHADAVAVTAVEQLVSDFEPGFAQRVRVHHVTGGGRSAPLNAALEDARGRFVAIVDDDDVVTAGWISAFKRAAERSPGRAVRAAVVVQWVEKRDGALVDFEPVSGFEATYPRQFDFVDAIRTNRSPSCCYAVPLDTVRAMGIRFDESLRVCEDWKFQLEVTRLTGVSDVDAVTSVYRRWRGEGGSQAEEPAEFWMRDHERVIDDLDREPTLVPAGSMRRIHELYRRIELLEEELGTRSPNDPPLGFAD